MSALSNPTGRFTARADDYAKWRPDYPADVISFWMREFGWRPNDTIADLGSGTGIMTARLLDAGFKVLAIEPNADMRRAAESEFLARPAFRSVAGSAEASTLAPQSADGAVAAQAFHWFDPDTTRRELLRILRPPGTVGIVWNVRQMDSTPFLAAYEAFLHEWGTDYAAVQNRQAHPEESLGVFFKGHPVSEEVFGNAQQFGYEGLEGRLLSCSYVPKSNDARFHPMLEALRALFEAFQAGGEVSFRYDVRAYAATLA